MSKIKFIKVEERDTVATALKDATRGDTAEVSDKEIGINENIKQGHKIALVDTNKGDFIYKYGEIIGVAEVDIKSGDWVHTHNLGGYRARGDLAQSEENDE